MLQSNGRLKLAWVTNTVGKEESSFQLPLEWAKTMTVSARFTQYYGTGPNRTSNGVTVQNGEKPEFFKDKKYKVVIENSSEQEISLKASFLENEEAT